MVVRWVVDRWMVWTVDSMKRLNRENFSIEDNLRVGVTIGNKKYNAAWGQGYGSSKSLNQIPFCTSTHMYMKLVSMAIRGGLLVDGDIEGWVLDSVVEGR
jgi:hypothetical protein